MFGILGPVEGTGETFKTFDELFSTLKSRMAHEGYRVVKSRTHRYKTGGNYARDGEIVRCDLVCDRGGQPYRCQATRLKTSTKKTDCPWKAKAVNRKTLGAWVLTVLCDEHNHEPRTPEPPSDIEPDAEGDAEVEVDHAAITAIGGGPAAAAAAANALDLGGDLDDLGGPGSDPQTARALAVAGVSANLIRLTGDTFHQFKTEYRKMSKPERIGILAQLQLRVAAIYAVENEDLQRHHRQLQLEKRHLQIEENRRQLTYDARRARQPPHQAPTQLVSASRLSAQQAMLMHQQNTPTPASTAPPPAGQALTPVQPVQQTSQQPNGQQTQPMPQPPGPISQTPVPIPRQGAQAPTATPPATLFRHYNGPTVQQPPQPQPPQQPQQTPQAQQPVAPTPRRRGRPPANRPVRV